MIFPAFSLVSPFFLCQFNGLVAFLLRHDLVLVNDAERGFFISLYGFHLIPISGTVEKKLLLLVKITEGDCIRIALFSLQASTPEVPLSRIFSQVSKGRACFFLLISPNIF